MKASSYKYYLLVMLMVVYGFNGLDRVAMGLVLQNIKHDLHLNYTQLGFLTGISFALFYSVMGVPIARWADRGNRVTIIALTTAVWSVMLALCGFAANFVQLLAIRVGVAIGEAGCLAPANSLIADYFTRAERPRAVSLYLLGGPITAIIGSVVVGWINQYYGWRLTFILIGLPGLVLGLIAWFTLREPRFAKAAPEGGGVVAPAKPDVVHHSLKTVFVTLWSSATFRNLLLTFLAGCFFAYGIGQWQPAFFIRSYGLKTGALGTWYAMTNGVGGLIGTYLGGALATRFAPHDERRQFRIIAVMYSASGIIAAFIYLSHSLAMSFVLVGLVALVANTIFGPLFGTVQTLVPERMRATAIAIFYLFGNLIGMGLGPLLTGTLSDVLHPWFGPESLRYALLALCPGYFCVGWFLYRVSRTVTGDLEVVHGEVQART